MLILWHKYVHIGMWNGDIGKTNQQILLLDCILYIHYTDRLMDVISAVCFHNEWQKSMTSTWTQANYN